MSYKRVVPRDFFNESKLLKCLGAFEIAVMNHMCNGIPIKTCLISESGFEIKQDDSDGSLYCSNYVVSINDKELRLFTSYNDKSGYPLFAEYNGEIHQVFDDDGNFILEINIEGR